MSAGARRHKSKPPGLPPVSDVRDHAATTTSVPPQLLTIAEVAEILRTTSAAIYAMKARGQLPGVVQIGRRTLVDRAEQLQWLETRRAMSPMERRR